MSWCDKIVIVCGSQRHLFVIPRIRVRPGEMATLVSPLQTCFETTDELSWNWVGLYGGGGALPGHWKHWTGIGRICLFILGGQTILSTESAFFCSYKVWMRGRVGCGIISTLKLETAYFPETLLFISKMSWCYILGNHVLNTHHSENMKNYIIINLYFLSTFLYGSKCLREFSHHKFILELLVLRSNLIETKLM
jgi:hypothetical protein